MEAGAEVRMGPAPWHGGAISLETGAALPLGQSLGVKVGLGVRMDLGVQVGLGTGLKPVVGLKPGTEARDSGSPSFVGVGFPQTMEKSLGFCRW